MRLRVPATSANLGPGFDTLGVALTLYNEFILTPSVVQSIKIEGEGEGVPKLLKDNNFIKIFRDTYLFLSGEGEEMLLDSSLRPDEKPENPAKFHASLNAQIHAPSAPKIPPFSFHLINSIPISRGLGSSSAVIIGAVLAAYETLKIPYTPSDILSRALKYEKHADNITPALNGGFNIALAKNNKVFFIKQPVSSDICAVVVVPPRATSTKYSRKTLPKQYSAADSVFNIAHSSMIAGIFMSQKWELLRTAAEDKIHQDKRMAHFPVLFSVRKEALKNGALMSVLSGSGSSFLSVCYRDDAPRIAAALRARFSDFCVLELDFDNGGARID